MLFSGDFLSITPVIDHAIVLFTETDIVIQRLIFVRIVDTVLQTASFNFTVVGSPVLVPGPLGGLALQLNGVDQYMDLTQQPADGCLWDLNSCDLGLTVTFRIRVTEVR